MNSFLRRTVPAAFLAGGIVLGGASAAGAQLPVDSLLDGASEVTGQSDASGLLSNTLEMLTSGDMSDAIDIGGTPVGGIVPMAGETVDDAAGTAEGTGGLVEGVVNGTVETQSEQGGAVVQTQGAGDCAPGYPCPAQVPEFPETSWPDCEDCEPTTTVPHEVTTTVPHETTTTVPAETTTTMLHPDTVPPTTVAHAAPELPRTGSTVAPWVAVGAALLVVGGAFVALSTKGTALRRRA